MGDFNACSYQWGYHKEDIKGRKLAANIADMSFTLLKDPLYTTRIDNSVAGDTCPDLSLIRNAKRCAWINTEETLGSDHRIIMVTVETQKLRHTRGQARITDWTKFRDSDLPALNQAGGYHAWAAALIKSRDQYTHTIQTT